MKTFLEKLSQLQLGISMISLVAVIGINFIEILGRYLFNSSLVWVQDVSLLFMVWMIFPGSSVIAYQKRDVVITLLTDVLPERANKHLDYFKNGAVSLFFLVFSYYTLTLFLKQQGQTTVTASLPLQWYTLSLLINSSYVFLVYLREFMLDITGKNLEKEGQ
ncbi:MAG: hypothetical protein AVO33_00310 [delta proteobacterium ML8_F1]|nr:MAG: hypothetical protein AVO33_00310 [delta proteobacterium ML8_F1]